MSTSKRTSDARAACTDAQRGAHEGFTFTVIGKIVPAVRMTQRSKYVSTQAQRYLAYKDRIGWTAKEAGAAIWEGPIALTVTAWARDRKWDASNVLKAVEDSLNGICWVDDKQIVEARIRVCELWGRIEEFMVVTITEGDER